MKEKSLIVILLYNICVLVAWLALAIVFNRWWIMLFSTLFIYLPSYKHKYYRICDGCGKHSEYCDTREEALNKAKAAGWKHYQTTDKDYCPECLNKIKRARDD